MSRAGFAVAITTSDAASARVITAISKDAAALVKAVAEFSGKDTAGAEVLENPFSFVDIAAFVEGGNVNVDQAFKLGEIAEEAIQELYPDAILTLTEPQPMVMLDMDVGMKDLTSFDRTQMEEQLQSSVGIAMGGALQITEVAYKIEASLRYPGAVTEEDVRKGVVDLAESTLDLFINLELSLDSDDDRRLGDGGSTRGTLVNITITVGDAEAADAVILGLESLTHDKAGVAKPSFTERPSGFVAIVAAVEGGSQTLDQSTLRTVAGEAVQEIIPGAILAIKPPRVILKSVDKQLIGETAQKSSTPAVNNSSMECGNETWEGNETGEGNGTLLLRSSSHRRRWARRRTFRDRKYKEKSGCVTMNIYSSNGAKVVSTTDKNNRAVEQKQEDATRLPAGATTSPPPGEGAESASARRRCNRKINKAACVASGVLGGGVAARVLPEPIDPPSPEVKEEARKRLKACADEACREAAKQLFAAAAGNRSAEANEAFFKQAEADAAKDLARETVSRCFATQLSLQEKAECFTKSKAELEKATDAFMGDLPAEVKERKKKELGKEAARSALGEGLTKCLAKPGADRAGCMAELAETKGAVGLEGEDASAIALRHFQATLADASSSCTEQTCHQASKKAAVAAGMLEREYAKVKDLGDVKAAAEIYASCKSADSDEVTCLGLARDEYLRVSGAAADAFETNLLVRVQTLGQAIQNGTPIVMVRLKRMAVSVMADASAAAELLDSLVTAIENRTFAAAAELGLEVHPCKGAPPCKVQRRRLLWAWALSVALNVHSETSDEGIGRLSELTVAGLLKASQGGRRLGVAGIQEVYASQDAVECSESDTDCLAGKDSAAPTPEPTKGPEATPAPPAPSSTPAARYGAPDAGTTSPSPKASPTEAPLATTSVGPTEDLEEPISRARGGSALAAAAMLAAWVGLEQ